MYPVTVSWKGFHQGSSNSPPAAARCLLRKLPLLPSPGHVAVPLGHVWDVLLPADGYNRKLSGYDAYVTWRSPEVV